MQKAVNAFYCVQFYLHLRPYLAGQMSQGMDISPSSLCATWSVGVGFILV